MNRFVFKSYQWDESSQTASFSYGFTDKDDEFTEKITFESVTAGYDHDAFKRVLFLAFVLVGTSYYKTFPTKEVVFETDEQVDTWQAAFFSQVYQEGLGQFAYENQLSRHDLAHFVATGDSTYQAVPYTGNGILSLQSGGKDSLLTATLLEKAGHQFDSWYLSSGESHPVVIDELPGELLIAKRSLDLDALKKAREDGAFNGHVPVTYITQTFALLQAILSQKNTVLVSIAHEGEEPHAHIDDLAVTHQWSKTWLAEQQYAQYLKRYVSPDIKLGSPLRSFTELRVAELFAHGEAWKRYAHQFSSCNLANYAQQTDNTHLSWCGDCPKCANTYLLFAPFVHPDELWSLFGGQDLFGKESLQETFKGLLGIDGVVKPFECVGEVDELRLAYHWAQRSGVYARLSFECPSSTFNHHQLYPAQDWATSLL